MINDSLSSLKDIHLPPPISIWPLTIGWYLLAAVVLLILAVLTIYFLHHYKHSQKKREIIKTYRQLYATYHNNTVSFPVAELAIFLRRIALNRFPREEVAGLQGIKWLQFLDKTGQTTAFSQGPGKILLTAPYQATTKINLDELFLLIEQWIKRNL